MTESTKQIEKKAYTQMKAKYGYKGPMAAPRMKKIVVAIGTGSGLKKNKDFNKLVMDRLAKITGQKPATRGAKKSVAGFKIRLGDQVGVLVTLRGDRMYGFLDKLINVAIPRTKDFRGIDKKVVDNIGNMTQYTDYNKDGSVSRKVEYRFEYDLKGNWIKEIQIDSGIPVSILERELQYYQ